MPNNPPNTDNHNLPKIPPLDTEYADEWGYIYNNGQFADGSDAGTPGVISALEERLVVVDTEANQSNYTAYQDAVFISSDTNSIFLGDGTNWIEQDFGGGTDKTTAYFHGGLG